MIVQAGRFAGMRISGERTNFGWICLMEALWEL